MPCCLIPKSFPFVLGLLVCVCIQLTGCRSLTSIGPVGDQPDADRLDYQIVAVVHGDADYLYHDSNGSPQRADERMIRQLLSIGDSLRRGEMYIFHQRRKRHFLGLSARRESKYYHVVRGEMLREARYTRRDQRGLEAEGALLASGDLKSDSSRANEPVRVFLYFGHRIPEDEEAGYHESFPASPLSIDDLASMLESIATRPIDLAVISTCNNGTPGVVSALAPNARFVMASPTKVHLTYYDIHPLLELEHGLQSVEEFAKMWQVVAAEKLERTVQTEVAVALYDTRKASDYLLAIEESYGAQQKTNPSTNGESEDLYVDCATYPRFQRNDLSEGVTIFFRSAKFGRFAGTTQHSGWGCAVRSSGFSE